MNDIDVQTQEEVVSVVVEETQAVVSVLEEGANVTVEETAIELLIAEETIATIDVEISPPSFYVETLEQGPPGPSFQAEKTDIWIAPVEVMTLSFNPRNLKFFINGIKQDLSLIALDGQDIQLFPEIIFEIYPGDKLEFVYNYMES